MKLKICSRCKKRKSLSEFSKHRRYKYGYNCWCKKCLKEYDKEYRKKYKELIKKYREKYYRKNKERFKERTKKFFYDNKGYMKKYQKEKKKRDLNYRVSENLRTRIWGALKGRVKSQSTMFLIGCSIEYLMYHLQYQLKKGMSWDNYGREGWHIDHIKPCVSFDLSKVSEQQKCFHYSNLQPLWAKDNLSKGVKK